MLLEQSLLPNTTSTSFNIFIRDRYIASQAKLAYLEKLALCLTVDCQEAERGLRAKRAPSRLLWNLSSDVEYEERSLSGSFRKKIPEGEGVR